jgi:ATP-dependent Lon protease
VAEEKLADLPVVVDVARVRDALGKRRYFGVAAEQIDRAGVAIGLVWTAVGGEILFVEASLFPGKGDLRLTGQLGDVMRESAHAAMSWLKAHADQLGIESELFTKRDIHVHVPAGAQPKEGPSAGVTVLVALASALTGRRARDDIAMTGEITLRGRVLPIGGVKEKVLGAHRAGLRRILLPARNEADLDDVPAELREELEILMVESTDDVLDAALTPAKPMSMAKPRIAKPRVAKPRVAKPQVTKPRQAAS